jgi:hypothetical protein
MNRILGRIISSAGGYTIILGTLPVCLAALWLFQIVLPFVGWAVGRRAPICDSGTSWLAIVNRGEINLIQTLEQLGIDGTLFRNDARGGGMAVVFM